MANHNSTACLISYARRFILILSACTAPFGKCAEFPQKLATDIRRDATVEAVEKVLPCVVNIGTETLVEPQGPVAQLLRDFYGPYYRVRPEKQYSLGSGVIVDEAGFILTNDHVVRQASKIWVKLHDGREYQADQIVFASRSDVALLKIRSTDNEKFKAAQFAADDDLLLGETVLALGNPFGLGGSVSKGILSSKNRRPPLENSPLDIADWLQTDAPINPGNSGGPLVNLKGELIGINVAVFKEAQGIGFAIPIKRVAEGLSEIFTPEALKGLWFGAKIKAGGLPLSVLDVYPGSPAEKAGLRKGDVIVSLNDQKPRSFLGFIRQLSDSGDQGTLALAFDHGGEHKSANLHLVRESAYFNTELIREKIGATLEQLTPRMAQTLRVGGTRGLVIRSVDKRGPAATAELEPGMIVQGIDGEPIQDVTQAAKAINARKKGEAVTLNILVEQTRGNLILRDIVPVKLIVR